MPPPKKHKEPERFTIRIDADVKKLCQLTQEAEGYAGIGAMFEEIMLEKHGLGHRASSEQIQQVIDSLEKKIDRRKER